MKAQEDKHRSDRQFAVGDWAFLKLQPYVQQSVVRRSNHKLGFKYFGPYKIMEKVGDVAYRLALPASSKIHPVVHVSLLKPAQPPSLDLQTEETVNVHQVFHTLRPAQVLRSRLVQVGSYTCPQLKIAWAGLPLSMATWEWSSALTPTTMAG